MWFADAGKIHSFTYTPDAAKATAILGNAEEAYNQVWHLPTDATPITGKQMSELFANEMKASSRLFVLPKWLLSLMGVFSSFMREMAEMIYQYDRDYFFDSSRFDQHFNFNKTTYAQGVKNTVQLSD